MVWQMEMGRRRGVEVCLAPVILDTLANWPHYSGPQKGVCRPSLLKRSTVLNCEWMLIELLTIPGWCGLSGRCLSVYDVELLYKVSLVY